MWEPDMRFSNFSTFFCVLLLSYRQPTNCCSRRSSLRAIWSTRWKKEMHRSAGWRSASPPSRTMSGARPSCSPVNIIFMPCPTFLSLDDCFILLRSCHHLSFSIFFSMSSFNVWQPSADLNVCFCPLDKYANWQTAGFLLLLSTAERSPGASRMGVGGTFFFFLSKCCQASQASLHLSGILKFPCGCAGLSVTSRDTAHGRFVILWFLKFLW